jgi:hypothetical protein
MLILFRKRFNEFILKKVYILPPIQISDKALGRRI